MTDLQKLITERRGMLARMTEGPWTIETPIGEETPWIVQSGKPAYEWACIAMISADGEDIPVVEGLANTNGIATLRNEAERWLTLVEAQADLLGWTTSGPCQLPMMDPCGCDLCKRLRLDAAIAALLEVSRA